MVGDPFYCLYQVKNCGGNRCLKECCAEATCLKLPEIPSLPEQMMAAVHGNALKCMETKMGKPLDIRNAISDLIPLWEKQGS